MTSIVTTPAAVERASNQEPQTESVSHRVRYLLVAGAVVVVAAIALLIWALVPASSSSSPVNPTGPRQVQRVGSGDFQNHGENACVVAPGTNYC